MKNFVTQGVRDEMIRDEKENTAIYKVVVNHREQYSRGPAEPENPLGWRDGGKGGSKAETSSAPILAL